jgi:hypothetical protein
MLESEKILDSAEIYHWLPLPSKFKIAMSTFAWKNHCDKPRQSQKGKLPLVLLGLFLPNGKISPVTTLSGVRDFFCHSQPYLAQEFNCC